MIENNEICLHLKTPLLFSHELSLSNSPIDGKRRNIYLKLDNCQPSGSFKIRGIGHLIYQVDFQFKLPKTRRILKLIIFLSMF